MKILLINPVYARYGGVEGHGGRVAPLNLGYLASYLRGQKPHLKIGILDCEALDLTFKQIEEQLKKIAPDIIGLTMSTPAYSHVVKIAEMAKSLNSAVKIIAGGPHPTALPADVLKEDKIDFAVMGEGELTLAELVGKLEAGANNFSEVAGLGYKDGEKIIINPRRALIKDLDILPYPAKDLMPLDLYFLPPTKRISSRLSTNIITSRGCPFNCTFCMAQTVWGRTTRMRSIANVIGEIEECVKKYNLSEFTFHDEFFTLNKKRVLDFCGEIAKRQIDISWFCQARAGSVDEEILRAMKKAGCGKIGFGFESGSEKILKLMNKHNDLNKAKESVRLCKKEGIKAIGAFIIGYPGETAAHIRETINFAKSLDLDTAAFFTVIPYPGTELYELARREGYLRPDAEWLDYAPLGNTLPPMMIPGLTSAELMAWKKRAYREFYLRPKYILKKLSAIKNFEDIKNLFRGFTLFQKVS